jgi:hypothetical protein
MSKPKFASLTAGLLARKGEAQPAAPHHGFALLRGPSRAPEAAPERNILKDERIPSVRRDCVETLPGAGEAPPRGAGPARSFRIVAADAAHAARTVALHVAHDNPGAARKRTAVTVRLDETRYLRLKLTGARLHRTNQDLLTGALDTYLAALGVEDIEAAALPSKG